MDFREGEFSDRYMEEKDMMDLRLRDKKLQDELRLKEHQLEDSRAQKTLFHSQN